MIKSKKLQILFIICGVALSFISSEMKASSITEEAFLPVQGYLIKDEHQGGIVEGAQSGHYSSIDNTVEIQNNSPIFDSLPHTGEKENNLFLCSGFVLITALFIIILRHKRCKERNK
ncbi:MULTISPECIES: LPXTG cell wall anchor domain-containing protein [Lactococcus]|uniref:LPXTG cell wall anchor domain-containing protein n=1 Tax=Lactococcus TaxID=1357 RepID=UPI003854AC3E